MQILVLGMHRSGTSIAARLLNMMGVYFAPEGVSIGMNEQNPKGFWERQDVRALNDQVLHATNADWHVLSDFSLDRVPAAALLQFKKEARKIVLAMDGHRPWFLKEPRLCVLAPLWLELLEIPICLFVHRSPLEVARSLQMRNRFPLQFGLALWEYYNVEAFNGTRGRTCFQVTHAELLSNPVACVRRLTKELEAVGVSGLRTPSDNEVTAFIDPSLYRAKESNEDRDYLSEAQKELQAAIETGAFLQPGTHRVLSDSAKKVLQEYEQTIANELKAVKLEARNATLSAELASIKKQLAERDQLVKKSRDISRQVRESMRDVTETVRQTVKAEVELGRREREIATLREELKEIAKAASAREAGLNDLVARREAALAQEHTKVEELTQVSKTLKQSLDAVEEYFGKLTQAPSFRFAVYTARRLGLVSRNPRRLVEAIRNQFPAARKALKQIKESGKVSSAPAGLPELKEAENEENEELLSAVAAAERATASAKNAIILPTIISAITGSVCFIILHRLGAHHLRSLFSTFLRVNTFTSAEFMIVLHACTDKSREVIETFRKSLQIKVIDCPENRSFAYSNNRAAEQVNADYLFFLNNDIIFHEDVVPEMLRCLQDSRTGLVGTRLHFPANEGESAGDLQHAGIKFRPDPAHFFYRPFNLGAAANVTQTPCVPEKFPAVTAALMACRRRDFLKAGGFCEDYRYGYEDVDLGLTFRRLLGLRCVSANHVSCIHNESATGKLDLAHEVQQRRANNVDHITRRHGWYLRRKIALDRIAGQTLFSEERLTVAFAVTEATPTTTAGDYFTASELANACTKEFGWQVRYLSRNEDWYDLRGVDVLVVLLDAYDLSKVRNAEPGLVKIAWMRNWFERWASQPQFDGYDLYLCSSVKSAEWLRQQHRKYAWVFPLATSFDRFAKAKPDPNLSSDYCFTGSYWKVEREIGTAVQPEKLDGLKFVVYGSGWESHPGLRSYARGFLPYEQMPQVYASTRVVVDDANHVTKDWGSVNSRVFDALAAGALVISNGEVGAAEAFDRELPTYRSPDDLEKLLRRYLGNESERQKLAGRLREKVLTHHTYRHRARTLKRILLSRARSGYRVAFKIGAPTRREIQHWGDYHFARSLGRCLAASGHSFRIDCIDEWERPESFGDDVVIVLRGLSRYRPKLGQINLMWNISHPDKIEDEEYENFDHVLVASRIHAMKLAQRLQTSVSALLQCTDENIFYPDQNPDVPVETLLFVGNSRKQYREAVRFAVEAEMPIGVYGTHWSMFIPPDCIRGEYIDNSLLRQHYSRCQILLNDHWPSMRESGFISNRLFDGAAAGAFIISDAVEDAAEIFGEDLIIYRDESEFRNLVEYYMSHPEERRSRAERLRSRVLTGHTFAHRAEQVVAVIKELDKRKRGLEELSVVSLEKNRSKAPASAPEPMSLVAPAQTE